MCVDSRAAVGHTELTLAALVERHQSWLIHLAASYLGNLHSAQDCVQDVFLTAITKLDTKLPETAVRNWLATCTINRAKSMLRAARIRRWALIDWASGQGKDSGGLDDYSSLDETGVLAEVMKLPVRYREVIVLRYYHDLDTRTISAVIGVSENTVKTRLRRAKDRLRRALSGALHD